MLSRCPADILELVANSAS